jgi:hypothetical protein
MSAHDHPGLSNITNLAVAVAFLQRVLSVHEIASCHFDLGGFDVVNVTLVDGTAAFLREIGLRGVLKVGLQKRCELVDVVDDGTVLCTVA